MDVYGMQSSSSTPDHMFRIDDLLDLSNDDLFSSYSSSSASTSASASSSSDSLATSAALPPLPLPDVSSAPIFPSAHELPLSDGFSFPPSDDVAELEWLSRFVDDSLSDVIPTDSLAGTLAVRPDAAAFAGESQTKRSKAVRSSGKLAKDNRGDGHAEAVLRRCTHCASEKTPQWRTGPLGPKTLCNACGVRYKSGRLVPEYRPAASPTFVLTQHSNSHRKVMELRRQKEMLWPEQLYHGRDHQPQLPPPPPQQQQQHDFQVC